MMRLIRLDVLYPRLKRMIKIKMTTTLVLGMPRSGTSVTTLLLEKMGVKLDLDTCIDDVYKANHKFLQRRDVHFYIMRIPSIEHAMRDGLARRPDDIKILTDILRENAIIKEPYLLWLLPYIRKYIRNVIIVIRNPNEVIDSIKDFIAHNPISTSKINLQFWNNYYITFLRFAEEFNIPYLFVSYKDIVNTPTYVINSLYSFLSPFYPGIKKDIDPLEYIHANDRQLSMCNMPIETLYIYQSIIKGNKSAKEILMGMSTLDKGINGLCFCDSKRKYKKCCGRPYPE